MILGSPEEFKGHISNEYMPTVYEKVFVELGVPARLAQQASKVMVQDWSPEYKSELYLEIERLRTCVYTGMTQQVGERNTAMLQCCDVHCCCVAVLLCCSNTHTRGQAQKLEYLRFLTLRGGGLVPKNRPVFLWKDGETITQGQAERSLCARGVFVFGEWTKILAWAQTTQLVLHP